MSERALSTHKTHAQVFLYRKESLGFSTEHYNKLHEVLSIDGEPSWGQSWNVAEGEPAAYNLYEVPLWNIVSYFLQFSKRLEQRPLLQTNQWHVFSLRLDSKKIHYTLQHLSQIALTFHFRKSIWDKANAPNQEHKISWALSKMCFTNKQCPSTDKSLQTASETPNFTKCQGSHPEIVKGKMRAWRWHLFTPPETLS